MFYSQHAPYGNSFNHNSAIVYPKTKVNKKIKMDRTKAATKVTTKTMLAIKNDV